MKKFLRWAGLILLILAGTGATLYMIYLKPFMDKMKEVQIILLDSNFTVITGGGGNSGIFQSDSLVVVIDTKMDDAAKLLHDKVESTLNKRKLLVINTHWHPDHVSGNNLYKSATIMAGGSYSPEEFKKEAGKDNMANKWLKDREIIPVGADTLIVFNLARNVHTPSDIMVYSKQRQTLFGGDVILNKQVPILLGDADADAYVEEIMKVMQMYPIKRVIPGHGAIGGPEVLNDFLAFFEDMKTAASQPEQQDALVAKYATWGQIPIMMSPGSVIKDFRKKM